MPNWANVNNVGDPLAPGWQDQNLVTVKAPNGQSWRVYKPAEAAFNGLLGDLVAAGYNPVSGGGFNYRKIRGGSQLSQHAFGTAIDVSPDDNPMLNGQLRTNLPPNVAEIAAKHGLEWGGNWKNRPDPMHFEYVGGGQPAQSAPQVASGPAQPAPQQAMAAPGQAAPAAPFAGMPNDIGSLAAMFIQNAQAMSRREQERKAAEQARKVALFGGGDTLAGLFG